MWDSVAGRRKLASSAQLHSSEDGNPYLARPAKGPRRLSVSGWEAWLAARLAPCAFPPCRPPRFPPSITRATHNPADGPVYPTADPHPRCLPATFAFPAGRLARPSGLIERCVRLLCAAQFSRVPPPRAPPRFSPLLFPFLSFLSFSNSNSSPSLYLVVEGLGLKLGRGHRPSLPVEAETGKFADLGHKLCDAIDRFESVRAGCAARSLADCLHLG